MSFTKEVLPDYEDGSDLAKITPELDDKSPGRFSLVRRWDVVKHHKETFGPYASIEEVTEDLRREESVNNFKEVGAVVGLTVGFLGAVGGIIHLLNTGETTGSLLAVAGLSATIFGSKLADKIFDMRTSLSYYRTYLNENPIQFPDLGPVPLLRK